MGLRPAIDQVAHGKQAVTLGVEADLVQRRLQLVEAAVDVADRKVTAPDVGGDALHRLTGGVHGLDCIGGRERPAARHPMRPTQQQLAPARQRL